MPAKMLLLTEVGGDPAALDGATELWRAHRDARPAAGATLFRGLDGMSLLELAPVSGASRLGELGAGFDGLAAVLGGTLECDFRRQLLQFVEAPKPTDDLVPATPYVQLRHVEVRPRVHAEYRAWREKTIFNVVRKATEVEVFLAYHSLVSSEPGVMFVSGFSCDPDAYQSVFATDEYNEIVRQAGTRYITGGERGLYTKLYARVDDERKAG